MRLSKKQRNHGIGFDLTPMIDVVFQLIIFFMTCSQIAAIERAPVDLPKLAGATDASQRDVTINILPDGSMLLLTKKVTLDDVTAKVREIAAERGGIDKVTVALRVDATAKSAWPNAVVKALVTAGVKRGLIAVESATLTGA